MKTSQSAAADALRTTIGSSVSPNQTTPGRIGPLQCGQRGGISVNDTVSSRHRFGAFAQPRQQLTSQIEPCRLMMSGSGPCPADLSAVALAEVEALAKADARSCRPSTFCVIS